MVISPEVMVVYFLLGPIAMIWILLSQLPLMSMADFIHFLASVTGTIGWIIFFLLTKN